MREEIKNKKNLHIMNELFSFFFLPSLSFLFGQTEREPEEGREMKLMDSELKVMGH